jgi:hypothetical protein
MLLLWSQDCQVDVPGHGGGPGGVRSRRQIQVSATESGHCGVVRSLRRVQVPTYVRVSVRHTITSFIIMLMIKAG